MNLLIPYYLFLVAAAVLLLALRGSPLVSRKRSLYLSFLLVPPLLLVLPALNLGFFPRIVVMVAAILLVETLLRTITDQSLPRGILWVWLVLWVIELAAPLLVHFAFKGSADFESRALLFVGAGLMCGTGASFLILSSRLPRHT